MKNLFLAISFMALLTACEEKKQPETVAPEAVEAVEATPAPEAVEAAPATDAAAPAETPAPATKEAHTEDEGC